VLLYQMLLQQAPFRGEDEDEIYDSILADEPLYPIHMPKDAVSLLQNLLTRDPERRLGSGPSGAQDVKKHEYFSNIEWDDLYLKRVSPPFIPTVKGRTDTSNFDSEFTSVEPVLTPLQSGKSPQRACHSIKEWHSLIHYRNHSAHAGHAKRVPRLLAYHYRVT